MKKFNIFILFAFAMTFVFNISVTETYACSCVEPGSPNEELNNSSAVFSGKVVEIVDANKNTIIRSGADLLEIRFEVKEIWKGIEASEVIVKTPRYSDSCGFEFALNEEYLVYANETDGDFHVNLCSRTASLATATFDLNELGKGEIPSKQTLPSEEKSNGFNFQTEVILVTLLFVFGVVGLLLLRKGKKNHK